MDCAVHRGQTAMVRGRHVHVAHHDAHHDAPLPRLWSDSRDEDEPTKKVPDCLLAFTLACEDALDVGTQPMIGAPVHPPSGIVPAGTLVDEAAASGPREVIPPPPRRPDPRSLAFAATLDAFAFTDIPFLATAENDELPARRPSQLRANITQSMGAAVIALAAVLVLFALGTKPRVVVEPAARTAITAHARAGRSDPSGSARAPATSRVTAVRGPAPPKAPGRIIRTSPF